MKLMSDWRIIDVYQKRAAEAIEFQYTWWADPDNRTARGQEFINVCITATVSLQHALLFSGFCQF